MANISNIIANVPHLDAFDKILKDRFESFDFSPILMYIIDTAPESALIHLAGQFDVLGLKGWNLAVTIDDKRNLIKRAIELHRFKGTIWAVKEGIKSVGFDDAEIIEHVGFDFDGTWDFDGSFTYAGGNWATFRVKITLPNDRSMTAPELVQVRQMIEEYKNVRSHLVDVTLIVSFSDSVFIDDQFLDLGDGIVDTLAAGMYYDGQYNFNGLQTYNKAADTIDLKIINSQTGQITYESF